MIDYMSTLKERLLEAMQDAELKKTDLWKGCGLSSGAVSHWFSGNTHTLKGENLLKASKVLGVNPNWLATGVGQKSAISVANLKQNNHALADSIDNNILKIPLLNVVASMGKGSENFSEDVLEELTIHKSWAEKALKPYSSNHNLAFIHAVGDSMHPTFNDGDILMVDTGDKSVTADKIFVLEAHNRLFIKRVRQRLDGAFEISSDNPSVKTVDVLNGDHDVEIKGRVIWAWNGRKL